MGQFDYKNFLGNFRNLHDAKYEDFLLRHSQESDSIKVVEDFLKEIIDKSDFSMCLRVETLGKIIASDDFKTMIETGSGSTQGGVSTRREVTGHLFGIDGLSLPAEAFPKYGLLTAKKKARDMAIDPAPFYRYGSILVTFKKANLFHRTTFTVGSTLEFGEFGRKTPVFVDHPTALAVNNFMAFYRKIVNGDLSTDLPNHLADAFDGGLGFDCYELQFHGKLSFANDVEKIDYYPLYDNEEDELMKLAPKLNELGITYKSIINF